MKVCFILKTQCQEWDLGCSQVLTMSLVKLREMNKSCLPSNARISILIFLMLLLLTF